VSTRAAIVAAKNPSKNLVKDLLQDSRIRFGKRPAKVSPLEKKFGQKGLGQSLLWRFALAFLNQANYEPLR
jgi:hypothetical protein